MKKIRMLWTLALLMSIVPASWSADATTIESLIASPSMNVVISTSDPAKAKVFYGDVLKLKPMAPLMLPGNLEMTRYQVGTSEIKFLHNQKSIPNQAGSVRDAIGIRLLTFYLPDDGALAQRCKSHGFAEPRMVNPEKGKSSLAFVNDPDGNEIELVLLPPDSPKENFDKLAIGLTVSDVEQSRAFYGKILGLQELPPVDVALLGTKKYTFKHGTTTVKFWSLGGDLPKHTGRWQDAYGLRYIQYMVKDLDAVDSLARAAGANIHTPIFPLGNLARIMFIADPDGVINEFVGFPKK